MGILLFTCALHAQDAISRVQALEAEGRITGVMDDRGKFIYISREEMAATADFIMRRGRVAIAELAAKSSTLIDLEPKCGPCPHHAAWQALWLTGMVGQCNGQRTGRAHREALGRLACPSAGARQQKVFLFRMYNHCLCWCRQTTTADVPDFDWDVEEEKH